MPTDNKLTEIVSSTPPVAADLLATVEMTGAPTTLGKAWSVFLTAIGVLHVKHALATAANQFLIASGAGAWVAKTLAQTVVILDLAPLKSDQRVFRPNLDSPATGNLLVSATAYFTYMGKTVIPMTPKYVEFYVTVVGAGTQVAYAGLFSTPAAPNKAAQSLTKITATATVDALNSTGVKRNTNAFTTEIAAGTHLWAGIQPIMATTQPTVAGLKGDNAEGQILGVYLGANVLTDAGPFAGAIIAASNVAEGADLRVTLD